MNNRLRSFMMIAASVLVASAAATSVLHAQSMESDRRTISVTGESEVRVVPDEVVFNFGIETSSKNIDEARSENDKKLKDLLALATRLGIAKEHVQTDYLSVEPRYSSYDRSDRDRVFLGYFTTRSISITLKDLSKFEELLSDALKLGVNYVSQAQFRTSELRKHRDRARSMAIIAAREKAAALAGELGMKLGKPISISETTYDYGWQPRGRAMMQNSMTEIPSSGEDEGTIAPGQIGVSARISVVFEMQ